MHASANETIRTLIRYRPLIIETLEDVFGWIFWNHLDEKLSTLCLSENKNEVTLRERFSSLSHVRVEHDWALLPLYYLVDYLVLDHHEFRERDLLNIHRMIDECRMEFGANGSMNMDLALSFHDFRMEFLSHMEEEENYLFPKILRTEASCNHPSLSPEVFTGSISIYPNNLLHSSEAALTEMVSTIVSKAENLQVGIDAKIKMEIFIKAIKAYAEKIRAHAYLESEILFPRAMEMEMALRKRAESFDINREST